MKTEMIEVEAIGDYGYDGQSIRDGQRYDIYAKDLSLFTKLGRIRMIKPEAKPDTVATNLITDKPKGKYQRRDMRAKE
jgi:hypothetical protein